MHSGMGSENKKLGSGLQLAGLEQETFHWLDGGPLTGFPPLQPLTKPRAKANEVDSFNQYWIAFFAGCSIALISLILLPLLGYGKAIIEMAKTIERAAIPFLVGCAILFWLLQDKEQSAKIDSAREQIRSFEILMRERMDDPEKWTQTKKRIEEFQQKQKSQSPR